MKTLKESIDKVGAIIHGLYLAEQNIITRKTTLEEAFFLAFLDVFNELDRPTRDKLNRLVSPTFHSDNQITRHGIPLEEINFFRTRLHSRDALFIIFQNAHEISNKEIISFKKQSQYYYRLREALIANLGDTYFENVYEKTRIIGGVSIAFIALGTTIIPLTALVIAGFEMPTLCSFMPGASNGPVGATGDLLTDSFNHAKSFPLSILRNPLGDPSVTLSTRNKFLMGATYPLRLSAAILASGITFLGIGSIGIIAMSLGAGEIVYVSALNIPATLEKKGFTKLLHLREFKRILRNLPSYAKTLALNSAEGVAALVDYLKGPPAEKQLLLTWKNEESAEKFEKEVEITFEKVRANSMEEESDLAQGVNDNSFLNIKVNPKSTSNETPTSEELKETRSFSPNETQVTFSTEYKIIDEYCAIDTSNINPSPSRRPPTPNRTF